MSLKKCPCQQGKPYKECCQPFHENKSLVETPRQLIHARYSAFVLKLPDYIKQTMKDPALKFFDRNHILNSSLEWLGITVISEKYSLTSQNKCLIDFKIVCCDNVDQTNKFSVIETGLFQKLNNQWFYLDALNINQESF